MAKANMYTPGSTEDLITIKRAIDNATEGMEPMVLGENVGHEAGSQVASLNPGVEGVKYGDGTYVLTVGSIVSELVQGGYSSDDEPDTVAYLGFDGKTLEVTNASIDNGGYQRGVGVKQLSRFVASLAAEVCSVSE